MPKVRVPVANTVGKSVLIDSDGTSGAQIGVDLKLPDGSVPSLAELADALGVSVEISLDQIWPLITGVLKWDDLSDVNTSGKGTQDGAIPYWDEAAGRWIADTRLNYSDSIADLRLYNTARTGHVKLLHSGSEGQLSTGGVGTVDIGIIPSGGIVKIYAQTDFLAGVPIRIWNETDDRYIDFQATGAALDLIPKTPTPTINTINIGRVTNGVTVNITGGEVLKANSTTSWENLTAASSVQTFWIGDDFSFLGNGSANNFELASFTGNLWLRDGMGLRISDAADTDWIEGSHDGTNFNVAGVNTAAFLFRDGMQVHIYDSTDADRLVLRHDGVHAYIETAGAGPGHIRLDPGSTSEVQVRGGAALRVFDAADTNNFTVGHNGTNVVFNASSGLFQFVDEVNIASGNAFDIWDSTNADRVTFQHDGTDFNIIAVGTTDINISGAQVVIQNNDLRLTGAAAHVIYLGDANSGDNNWLEIGKGFNVSSGVRWIRSTTVDWELGVDASERLFINADPTSSGVGSEVVFQYQGAGFLSIDGSVAGKFVMTDGQVIIDGRTTAGRGFLANKVKNDLAAETVWQLYDHANVKQWDLLMPTDDSIQWCDNAGNIALQFIQGGDVRIRDGKEFRIYDSTDADFVGFSHDGTDFNLAGTNTTELNINSMDLHVTEDLLVDKATIFSGSINPTITANQNDWAPTGFADAFKIIIDSDGSYTITSMAGGVNGRLVLLINDDTTNTVTLEHGSASGTAANRFLCPNAANYVIPALGSVFVMYDTTGSFNRWRVIGPIA